MKVGDYVKTKYYGISKILNISNETTTNYCFIKLDRIDSFSRLGVYVTKDKIIKSSPNIIDLIEVGDYVNGHKAYTGVVVDTDDYGNDFKQIYVESDKHIYHSISEENIKSIVTKEQFESMEYKVGE